MRTRLSAGRCCLPAGRPGAQDRGRKSTGCADSARRLGVSPSFAQPSQRVKRTLHQLHTLGSGIACGWWAAIAMSRA